MSDGISDSKKFIGINPYLGRTKSVTTENKTYKEEGEYWKQREHERSRRNTMGKRLETMIRKIGLKFDIDSKVTREDVIYLAYPFTPHKKESYEITTMLTGILFNQGFNVFSPVSYTAQFDAVDVEGGWYHIDTPYLKMCTSLLTILPQSYSAGVAYEVGHMVGERKPIYYIEESVVKKMLDGYPVPSVSYK